jgi:hypothetical protein
VEEVALLPVDRGALGGVEDEHVGAGELLVGREAQRAVDVRAAGGEELIPLGDEALVLGLVGPVVSDFVDHAEGRLDDPNLSFTHDGDPANGMTMGGSSDSTAGLSIGWLGADLGLRFGLPPGSEDLSGYRYLSFRACQITRDPRNEAFLGDQQFEVGLRDGQGAASFLGIGAWGGGIEVPYQRMGCGAGVGWGNEFETIRIRLEDFTRNGAGIDLSDIEWIEFRFGPAHGSKEGHLGFDDLVLTRE